MIHYFGHHGVFIAGFLGKSILERKVIFWSWIIYFFKILFSFQIFLYLNVRLCKVFEGFLLSFVFRQ